MIWTPQNSKGMILVDSSGTQVPYVFEFNDETCEAKFYVGTKKDGKTQLVMSQLSETPWKREAVKCSAIIQGAKMIQREAA